MIADLPRAMLSELVGRCGVGLSGDARRCSEMLSEACGAAFGAECAALVAAVEHGIAGDLLKSAASSEPRVTLLDRLTRRLAAETDLSCYLARWSVECWAVALGAVPESARLSIVKMEGFARLIDQAATAGTISADAVDRLVDEAARGGIREADARAFLSTYLARHGWKEFDEPELPADDPPPNVPPGPDPAPTVVAGEPEVQSLGVRIGPREVAATPPAKTFPWRAAGIVVALLAVATLIGVVFLRQPLRVQPQAMHPPAASDDDARRAAEAEQRRQAAEKLRQKAELAERERQAYDAAHGNLAALQAYVKSCTLCRFAPEAREEIRRLIAVGEDERVYRQAHGKLDALRVYANSCDVCVFKSAALVEIAALERQEQNRLLPRAVPPAPRFTVYRHYDLPGREHDLTSISEPTVDACAANCSAVSECEAYTFDRWNRLCLLKRSLGTLVLNPKATTGVRRDLPAPPISQEATKIDRYRRKGFPDDNRRTSLAASQPECEQTCLSDDACMAYTFLSDRQQCLLFDDPGQYFADDNATSGVKIQRQ